MRARKMKTPASAAGLLAAWLLGLTFFLCWWPPAPWLGPYAGSAFARESTVAVYTVEKGDTLWKISRRFDVGLQRLMRANQIEDKNSIRVGQRLKIPGRKPRERDAGEKAEKGRKLVNIKSDPGGDRSSAYLLADFGSAAVLKGTLGPMPHDQEDCYRIICRRSCLLTVELESDGGDADLYLEDRFRLLESAVSLEKKPKKLNTRLDVGTYFVRVAGAGVNPIEYTLSISRKQP